MKTRIAVGIAALGLMWLVATGTVSAKQIEFPENDPAFSFTMPDSWTLETGKDGRIFCTAEDGFKIGMVASPSVTNADEAKALIPKVIKGMADAMKCEDYKPGEVHARELDNMWMAVMQAHGKSEGTDMSMNAVIFSLSPGKYFSIVGAAPASLDKAHDKDMSALIRSIKAVE